jgi:hypothetical protein
MCPEAFPFFFAYLSRYCIQMAFRGVLNFERSQLTEFPTVGRVLALIIPSAVLNVFFLSYCFYPISKFVITVTVQCPLLSSE